MAIVSRIQPVGPIITLIMSLNNLTVHVYSQICVTLYILANQAEVEGIVDVAMGLWEENTCLKFVPWTPQIAEQLGHGDYLEFQTHTKCSAAVGRTRPAQFVGLSSRGCSVSYMNLVFCLYNAYQNLMHFGVPGLSHFIDMPPLKNIQIIMIYINS